ncbi:MAG: aldehyde ferredoxin oxidoreductase [Deltaproteobacteria bacterium]|nr:aldehyde ferredoxin oxidoreductase [Deltaproteobacteria bacterium]
MRTCIDVDLESERILNTGLPEGAVWLGGRALGDSILLREVPEACHPLGSSNVLVFAPGLFAGTSMPTASRLSVVGKSPLTGGIKESNVGGMGGMVLAQLGIGAVVIRGMSDKECPRLLLIRGRSAELVEAPELHHLGNYQTVDILKKRFGQDVVILSIGPCGEMKMAAATIAVTDTEGRPCRHAGRGGLGGVMGSKGLKAIVIDPEGSQLRKAVDPGVFAEAAKEYTRILRSDKKTAFWRENGTAGLIDISHARGSLPTRNFSSGVYEKKDRLSANRLKALVVERGGTMGHACMKGCLVRCSNVFHDSEGAFLTSGLEYETIAMMGANLDIDDLDIMAQIDFRCDDYGMDTIEIGVTLGILTETELFRFGDGRRAIQLIDEIGQGTALGRVLGEGATRTGKAFGITRVPAVKGQALPAHEARALKGLGVTYATSPQGADHTAGFVAEEPLSHEGHTERSRDVQINIVIADSLGLCQFTGLRSEHGLFARLMGALTGKVPSEEDVWRIGWETLRKERAFNLAAGIGPGQDRLPEFLLSEPLPPHGTVFDVKDEDLDRVFGDQPK